MGTFRPLLLPWLPQTSLLAVSCATCLLGWHDDTAVHTNIYTLWCSLVARIAKKHDPHIFTGFHAAAMQYVTAWVVGTLTYYTTSTISTYIHYYYT